MDFSYLDYPRKTLALLFRHKRALICLILVFFVGLGLGWWARGVYVSKLPSKLVEVRENNSRYRYINPLLLVDTPRQAPEYEDLNEAISNYVSAAKRAGRARDISVYFRDLNVGKWSGVNEDEVYDPSSMLKVAVMIGYLRKADRDPNSLLKYLDYTAHNDPGQNYKPLHPLQTGTYTARELIEAMIIDSDNDALNSLYANDHQSFIDVIKRLNIKQPPAVGVLDFMSPKTYSEILRTLFSSTYLSRGSSEQALQMLSYTTFKKGLVAGVPSDVVVAHKFGEHTDAVNGQPQSVQLHDCGIIYYPSRPYLLCVMTRGDNFGQLEKVISNISKITYDNISAK